MFGAKLRRLPIALSPIVRQQTNIATNLTNDNLDGKLGNDNSTQRCASPVEKTIRDKHLANITVTSFYSQTAIEQLAVKVRRISICMESIFFSFSLAIYTSYTIDNDVRGKIRRWKSSFGM